MPIRQKVHATLEDEGLWPSRDMDMRSADRKVFHLGARVISRTQRFGHRHGCKQMNGPIDVNFDRRVKTYSVVQSKTAQQMVHRTTLKGLQGRRKGHAWLSDMDGCVRCVCALLTAVAALGAEDRDGV